MFIYRIKYGDANVVINFYKSNDLVFTKQIVNPDTESLRRYIIIYIIADGRSRTITGLKFKLLIENGPALKPHSPQQTLHYASLKCDYCGHRRISFECVPTYPLRKLDCAEESTEKDIIRIKIKYAINRSKITGKIHTKISP